MHALLSGKERAWMTSNCKECLGLSQEDVSQEYHNLEGSTPMQQMARSCRNKVHEQHWKMLTPLI